MGEVAAEMGGSVSRGTPAPGTTPSAETQPTSVPPRPRAAAQKPPAGSFLTDAIYDGPLVLLQRKGQVRLWMWACGLAGDWDFVPEAVTVSGVQADRPG
jgi:hypothetical protein